MDVIYTSPLGMQVQTNLSFILAYKLQWDMTADSLIEVVQGAVDRTGMTEVPVADTGPGC